MSRELLERDLHALAGEVAWPQTPDVAGRVVDGLPDRMPSPRRGSVVSPRLRLALAMLLALVVAAAAVPPVRAAIERALGLAANERIERTDGIERRPPAARLDLGRPVTLAQARAAADFEIALPEALGPPDGVHVGGDLADRAVSLRYGADTVLTETAGSEVLLAIKQIAADVPVVPVTVRGARGFWIARGPRVIVLPQRDGTTRRVRAALPGAGVLLWDRGGVAFRLETRRPQAEALAIARSVG